MSIVNCQLSILNGNVSQLQTPVHWQNTQKEMPEFVKKCLTNRNLGGIICKLSDERLLKSREGGEKQKIPSKKEEKLLDKLKIL